MLDFGAVCREFSAHLGGFVASFFVITWPNSVNQRKFLGYCVAVFAPRAPKGWTSAS